MPPDLRGQDWDRPAVVFVVDKEESVVRFEEIERL